jgi:uncharacterized repeat protein (TIGR01451 family)
MRWFLGASLVLFLALAFQLSLMAYAMYALVALMAASWLAAETWIGSLGAQRHSNRLSAEIGDTVAVIVNVQNQGRLPVLWVLMEDLLPRQALLYDPPYLRVTGRRLKLAFLAPHAHTSLLYQIECNRRGYYQIGPLVLETGDLFGLHRRYRALADPDFLMVLPKVIPLEGFDIASRRPLGEIRLAHRLYEDPTRIAGVRPYELGDPLNRIHWRATARTASLQSKVYEPSTVAGATLLVDLHKSAHDGRNEPYRSDLAVTAAASIANAIYQMGQQVGLVTNGRDAADRIRQEGWQLDYRSRRAAQHSAAMRDRSDRLRPVVVPTRRGAEQLARILEALARIELTDGLDLAQLVTESTSRMPRDATVIAILPQVTMSEAITLGNLQRRGFAVSAILNLYDEYDFAEASGPLLASGIATHHLKDEQHIATICRAYVLR